TPYNTVANYVATKTGDPRVKQFEIARDAVASELRKVFAGAGGGSLHELEEWKKSLDAAGSPDQLRGVISKAVDLLKSRLDAVGGHTVEVGDEFLTLSPADQQTAVNEIAASLPKPQASAAAPPAAEPPSRLESLGRGAMAGATMNFGDELSGVRAAGPFTGTPM